MPAPTEQEMSPRRVVFSATPAGSPLSAARAKPECWRSLRFGGQCKDWARPASAGAGRPRVVANMGHLLQAPLAAGVLAESSIKAPKASKVVRPAATMREGHPSHRSRLEKAVPEYTKRMWSFYNPNEEPGEVLPDAALQLLAQMEETEDLAEEMRNEAMNVLRTGEDVIAFFAKFGDDADIKVFYCRHALGDPRKFRPYDLQVVPAEEKGEAFFMISSKGIVHVRPDYPSEHTKLSDWMHQAMIYSVLVSMRFFRNYLTGKAFASWRRGARHLTYRGLREHLRQGLYLGKPMFAAPLARIHALVGGLHKVQFLHIDTSSRSAIELDTFLKQQQKVQSRAMAEIDACLDAVRETLDTLVDLVHQAEAVHSDVKLTINEELRMPLVAQRLQKKQHARQLRICRVDKSNFGDLARLVDLMFQCFLTDLLIAQSATILTCVENTPRLFLISAAFAEDGESVMFKPSKKRFHDAVGETLHHVLRSLGRHASFTADGKYLHQGQPYPGGASDALDMDAGFQAVWRAILDRLSKDFDAALQASETYFEPFRSMYKSVCDMGSRDSPPQELGHRLLPNTLLREACTCSREGAMLGDNMLAVQRAQQELEQLKSSLPYGMLLVEARTLRAMLSSSYEHGLSAMKARLHAMARDACKQAIDQFDQVNRESQRRASVSFSEQQRQDLTALRAAVDEMYAMVLKYGIRIDCDEEVARRTLERKAQMFDMLAKRRVSSNVSDKPSDRAPWNEELAQDTLLHKAHVFETVPERDSLTGAMVTSIASDGSDGHALKTHPRRVFQHQGTFA